MDACDKAVSVSIQSFLSILKTPDNRKPDHTTMSQVSIYTKHNLHRDPMSRRQRVCELVDVPMRDMRCVSLEDKNVLVANTEYGVFVSDEMCTHEDARLCDGNLNGTLVKCPLHGSRFDLTTGAVLDDPAEDNLTIYPVTVENGVVYIQTDNQTTEKKN